MTPTYREHPTMFADEPGKFILACLLVPFGVGIIWLVWWYITNRSALVTIDEERVTLRRGIFSKESVEVEMGSIRAVRVDQSFVDRIFNCGILKVYTAGDNPEIVQAGLPDPDRLRAALRSARGA
ncbi:PH domain-containing protein [Acuticoccus mangrovi]|uniref:PH domain-containing protein n=1 Tax=Acuticoccus mangrovi TaxID=2796142 RepID=A0A934IRP6_9HYPH|nr:PH domain-containing protein [Acuticoccus mangrovi]MBJ3777413.1 PH domain-containing protein [Acuticoccus mangrovi]